ncbi:hypothetical protein FRB90_002002, partial [Tulasnella sp. 427]
TQKECPRAIPISTAPKATALPAMHPSANPTDGSVNNGTVAPTPNTTPHGSSSLGETPQTGQKRGHSQLEPFPAGGLRVNFVTGEPAKKPRTASTNPPPSETRADEDGDQPMSAEGKRLQQLQELEKKKAADKDALETKKANIKAFMDKYGGETQRSDNGTIRLITAKHPRYADPQSWVRFAIEFGPTTDALLKQLAAQTENWAWVQVYKHPNPNAGHLDFFNRAMRKVEGWNSEPGFLAGDYTPMLIKKQNGHTAAPFLVICETADAKMRLLKMGNFAYIYEEKEVAFFIQGPHSCGNSLVLEFSNAPASEEHLIKGAFWALKDVILWKEKSSDKCEAASFRIAKLDTPTVKGTRWLVAVKPDFKVLAEGWKYPEQAGDYGSTGEIQIKKPAWCKHCVSWSHDERYCEWWSEQTVTERGVAPIDYYRLHWKDHNTFTIRTEVDGQGKAKTVVETTKATSHPSLSEQHGGPKKGPGSGRGGFGGGPSAPRGTTNNGRGWART